nr:hypothetical protein [Pediococcus stilesii]
MTQILMKGIATSVYFGLLRDYAYVWHVFTCLTDVHRQSAQIGKLKAVPNFGQLDDF